MQYRRTGVSRPETVDDSRLSGPRPRRRSRSTPAEQTLTCTECGRVYEIRDGIPVLLLDEATPAATSGS